MKLSSEAGKQWVRKRDKERIRGGWPVDKVQSPLMEHNEEPLASVASNCALCTFWRQRSVQLVCMYFGFSVAALHVRSMSFLYLSEAVLHL